MRDKLDLKIRTSYEFKDDPILLEQLLRIIIATQEIADLSPEEAEKCQKNIF